MESSMEQVPAIHLVESLTVSESSAKVRKITLLEVLKQFGNEGQGIIIGTITPVDANRVNQDMKLEDLKLEGSAVVKKDKLVGYLPFLILIISLIKKRVAKDGANTA